MTIKIQLADGVADSLRDASTSYIEIEDTDSKQIAYRVLSNGVLQVIENGGSEPGFWFVKREFSPNAWLSSYGTRFDSETENLCGTDGRYIRSSLEKKYPKNSEKSLPMPR